ncbi:hypothetical protein FOCG_18171 [Fusarium oxysporum f. sp. radicis-lycopersici 26381]|nr:hypothetical protein FOCG_18171 [Fusarium oxysporum f. sp. radicis-lycopersici 26381]
MLLKHFLLGAAFALSSVAALPNPETDINNVEARDGVSNKMNQDHHVHCPNDASRTGNRQYPCVCKDRKKEFKGGKCVCRGDMDWDWHHKECRRRDHKKFWDDDEQECRRR